MWKRALVAVDGSEISNWAVRRAAHVLRQPGLHATLLSVVEADETRAGDLAFQIDPRHRARHDALASLRDALRADSVNASAEIRFGDPAREIVRECEAGGHDLIVMATHGRTGLNRLFFGSVALRVLQASPAPLLLFRPLQGPEETLSPAEEDAPARFRRFLLPLDGSTAAEEILPSVEEFARLFGAALHLFRAVPGGADEREHRWAAQEYLERWERVFGLHGIPVTRAVRTGAAGPEALAEVRESGADAIAMTTHGYTGLARALYGSVAERLIAEAGLPILILRNRAIRGRIPAPTEDHRFLGVR